MGLQGETGGETVVQTTSLNGLERVTALACTTVPYGHLGHLIGQLSGDYGPPAHLMGIVKLQGVNCSIICMSTVCNLHYGCII
jgi:hypothetical protein